MASPLPLDWKTWADRQIEITLTDGSRLGGRVTQVSTDLDGWLLALQLRAEADPDMLVIIMGRAIVTVREYAP